METVDSSTESMLSVLFDIFSATEALFQINYKILTMAANAMTVALAQSALQLIKMQVIVS